MLDQESELLFATNISNDQSSLLINLILLKSIKLHQYTTKAPKNDSLNHDNKNLHQLTHLIDTLVALTKHPDIIKSHFNCPTIIKKLLIALDNIADVFVLQCNLSSLSASLLLTSPYLASHSAYIPKPNKSFPKEQNPIKIPLFGWAANTGHTESHDFKILGAKLCLIISNILLINKDVFEKFNLLDIVNMDTGHFQRQDKPILDDLDIQKIFQTYRSAFYPHKLLLNILLLMDVLKISNGIKPAPHSLLPTRKERSPLNVPDLPSSSIDPQLEKYKYLIAPTRLCFLIFYKKIPQYHRKVRNFDLMIIKLINIVIESIRNMLWCYFKQDNSAKQESSGGKANGSDINQDLIIELLKTLYVLLHNYKQNIDFNTGEMLSDSTAGSEEKNSRKSSFFIDQILNVLSLQEQRKIDFNNLHILIIFLSKLLSLDKKFPINKVTTMAKANEEDHSSEQELWTNNVDFSISFYKHFTNLLLALPFKFYCNFFFKSHNVKKKDDETDKIPIMKTIFEYYSIKPIKIFEIVMVGYFGVISYELSNSNLGVRHQPQNMAPVPEHSEAEPILLSTKSKKERKILNVIKDSAIMNIKHNTIASDASAESIGKKKIAGDIKPENVNIIDSITQMNCENFMLFLTLVNFFLKYKNFLKDNINKLKKQIQYNQIKYTKIRDKAKLVRSNSSNENNEKLIDSIQFEKSLEFFQKLNFVTEISDFFEKFLLPGSASNVLDSDIPGNSRKNSVNSTSESLHINLDLFLFRNIQSLTQIRENETKALSAMDIKTNSLNLNQKNSNLSDCAILDDEEDNYGNNSSNIDFDVMANDRSFGDDEDFNVLFKNTTNDADNEAKKTYFSESVKDHRLNKPVHVIRNIIMKSSSRPPKKTTLLDYSATQKCSQRPNYEHSQNVNRHGHSHSRSDSNNDNFDTSQNHFSMFDYNKSIPPSLRDTPVSSSNMPHQKLPNLRKSKSTGILRSIQTKILVSNVSDRRQSEQIETFSSSISSGRKISRIDRGNEALNQPTTPNANLLSDNAVFMNKNSGICFTNEKEEITDIQDTEKGPRRDLEGRKKSATYSGGPKTLTGGPTPFKKFGLSPRKSFLNLYSKYAALVSPSPHLPPPPPLPPSSHVLHLISGQANGEDVYITEGASATDRIRLPKNHQFVRNSNSLPKEPGFIHLKVPSSFALSDPSDISNEKVKKAPLSKMKQSKIELRELLLILACSVEDPNKTLLNNSELISTGVSPSTDGDEFEDSLKTHQKMLLDESNCYKPLMKCCKNPFVNTSIKMMIIQIYFNLITEHTDLPNKLNQNSMKEEQKLAKNQKLDFNLSDKHSFAKSGTFLGNIDEYSEISKIDTNFGLHGASLHNTNTFASPKTGFSSQRVSMISNIDDLTKKSSTINDFFLKFQNLKSLQKFLFIFLGNDLFYLIFMFFQNNHIIDVNEEELRIVTEYLHAMSKSRKKEFPQIGSSRLQKEHYNSAISAIKLRQSSVSLNSNLKGVNMDAEKDSAANNIDNIFESHDLDFYAVSDDENEFIKDLLHGCAATEEVIHSSKKESDNSITDSKEIEVYLTEENVSKLRSNLGSFSSRSSQIVSKTKSFLAFRSNSFVSVSTFSSNQKSSKNNKNRSHSAVVNQEWPGRVPISAPVSQSLVMFDRAAGSKFDNFSFQNKQSRHTDISDGHLKPLNIGPVSPNESITVGSGLKKSFNDIDDSVDPMALIGNDGKNFPDNSGDISPNINMFHANSGDEEDEDASKLLAGPNKSVVMESFDPFNAAGHIDEGGSTPQRHPELRIDSIAETLIPDAGDESKFGSYNISGEFVPPNFCQSSRSSLTSTEKYQEAEKFFNIIEKLSKK